MAVERLNKNEKQFLHNVVKTDMNQREAYMDVYDCKPESASVAASRKLDQPKFKEAMRELYGYERDQGKYQISMHVGEAIEELSEILKNENAKVRDRLKASTEILDRAGVNKVDDESNPANKLDLDINFGDEDIADLQKTAEVLVEDESEDQRDKDQETSEESNSD